MSIWTENSRFSGPFDEIVTVFMHKYDVVWLESLETVVTQVSFHFYTYP